jgi:hypothetical protein
MLMSTADACTTRTQIAGKFRPNAASYTFSDIKVAGGNAFFTQFANGLYFDGPMAGTFTQSANWIVHFGNPKIVRDLKLDPLKWSDPRLWPAADFNARVDRTFTGTVNEASGTLTMHLKAKGSGTIGGTVYMEGTWVIISGTDGLAKLHGQGTWKGPIISGTTRYFEYEGQLWYYSRIC